MASPEKRHNNEKPPLEKEKKEKIELKSITSDGETNTATKVHTHKYQERIKVATDFNTVSVYVVREMNELFNCSKCDALPLQINMDDYCGDESEEKNPYPANDYIGNTRTRCVCCVYREMIKWMNG